MPERTCRACKRSLPEDDFRPRAASKKLKKKCHDCRTGKPYTRSPGPSTPEKRAAGVDKATPSPAPSSSASKPQEDIRATLSEIPKSRADESVSHSSPSASSSYRDDRSSPASTTASLSPRPSTSRTITAAVTSTKLYRHKPPPGLHYSGPLDATKSVQRQRRFLVPPGVTRTKQSDFPLLSAPLEAGMVAPSPGCLECSVKRIHCTYGAGVRVNGQTRDPATGKCDYCLFTTRKCQGNGYAGKHKDVAGAHTVLARLLDQVGAQLDTCTRAGGQDPSRKPNTRPLLGKIRSVADKMRHLESGLRRELRGQAGEAIASAIVIE